MRPGGPPIIMGGESNAAMRRAVTRSHGWYGFYLDTDEVRQALSTLDERADSHDRPAELGPLEITVTPAGPFDRSTRDEFEAMGVDRLVFLPQIDASRTHRHDPVPVDRIFRTIDPIADFAN